MYHLASFCTTDQSTTTSVQVLGIVHTSSDPHSKPLIVIKIVAHTCDYESTATEESVSHRAAILTVEASILWTDRRTRFPANGGTANFATHELDFQMLTAPKGQERTLEQIDRLLKSSGWRMQKAFRSPVACREHAVDASCRRFITCS